MLEPFAFEVTHSNKQLYKHPFAALHISFSCASKMAKADISDEITNKITQLHKERDSQRTMHEKPEFPELEFKRLFQDTEIHGLITII